MADVYDPEKAREGFERDVLASIVYGILWRQPDKTILGIAHDLRQMATVYEEAARDKQTDPARDQAAVWFDAAEQVGEMADDIVAERAKDGADAVYPAPD